MTTVAIVGASTDRAKYENKAARAFVREGYEVYPVNPRESVVEGLRAFARIGDIPVRLVLVSVYVRPGVLLGILPEIAAKGCDELWLNPGTESAEVLPLASELNLNVVQGCSILGIGISPADLK